MVIIPTKTILQWLSTNRSISTISWEI